MDSSAQYLMLPRREDFRDILEERRTSSDLSHALKSFTPVSSRGSPPCSVSTLNKTVLESQHLHYIMQEVSKDTGEPLEAIREEAAGILEEMSQDLQLGYIRFLGFILSKVFKRLFRKINVNEEGLQRLQQAMQESPVVLMPNHRSYVDFLVLSYLLFTYDLSIPVIAAGIPLMGMQLIGEILRRSGAFFIRRSIGTDKLYWAVLSEYVKTILRKGFAPVEFYVEGLRSRTLKSLPPKLGMMHMVLEPFFKGEVYDISLVPISISYDRVVEESLLAYELLGVPKPKETTMGLLKARKVMDEDFGNMHVCFGHPLSVRNLAKGKVNRNQYNLIPRDLPMKPSESIYAFANTTAHLVLRLQQENMVLSPWSLMAIILMQNLGGIHLKLLTKQTVWLKWLVQDFGALVDWPVQVADSEVMSSSLSLHHSVVRREGDQVLLVEQKPQRGAGPEEAVFRRAVAVLMCASYRNQALHVLASPAMLATALSLAAASSRADIYNLYAFLREMFYNEFIFIPDRTGQDFEEACSLLQKCGTVQITNQDITVTSKGLSVTSFLTAVVQPFIEAYQVIFRYICSRSVEEFTEKQFISGMRTFTLSLILTGEVKSYDVLSSDTQKNALTSLVRLNALTKTKREEQTYFSPNKAAIGRTADILAGKIPPQARTYSRL
ncbi:dihydroxyacetone phosphate acyltransferase [Brienomyrus brachyistius]|uniref:dihydroxyacetone phosphate acyltransferase n=1 Tax=Brienomyrus brachyistius TaxID=42636 RepID=UPI0020B3B894|nr:dihydroxyacetone phosphate acyltransferase [Brienomyrus brachyistius]